MEERENMAESHGDSQSFFLEVVHITSVITALIDLNFEVTLFKLAQAPLLFLKMQFQNS